MAECDGYPLTLTFIHIYIFLYKLHAEGRTVLGPVACWVGRGRVSSDVTERRSPVRLTLGSHLKTHVCLCVLGPPAARCQQPISEAAALLGCPRCQVCSRALGSPESMIDETIFNDSSVLLFGKELIFQKNYPSAIVDIETYLESKFYLI